VFLRRRARPEPAEVSAFIEEHRERFGVLASIGTVGDAYDCDDLWAAVLV
jgi:hypothetical protein